MSRAFVKLDKALDGWRFKHNPEYVALWVDILTHTFYADTWLEDVLVHRGECIVGRKALSQRTGISEQKLRTMLKKMNGEELTIKSTNRYTLIKVINWEKYQGVSRKSTSESTSNQPTTNQQLTTYKNYKNIKNDKNIDSLPVYDSSKNRKLIDIEIDELLKGEA